ncbi:MAG TPA: nucleotide exchange factor GrpE [Desulfobacterales bacterium]|nr:nucleotide exchange factor GrpE [Desulfobacterales bacterium]
MTETKSKRIPIYSETEKTDSDRKKSKKHDSEKIKKAKPKASLKELESKLESAENEAKENYDRFLRISAEFENYKKRSARQIDEFRKFANESLLKDMLCVVDNLERAVDSSQNDEIKNHTIAEGVTLTIDEISKIFKKFNVKPILSLNEPFDPNFHQAVMQEETEDYPDNVVLKELQKGYLMHDRLLRPAMVIVSKSKGEKNDPIKDETNKIKIEKNKRFV